MKDDDVVYNAVRLRELLTPTLQFLDEMDAEERRIAVADAIAGLLLTSMSREEGAAASDVAVCMGTLCAAGMSGALASCLDYALGEHPSNTLQAADIALVALGEVSQRERPRGLFLVEEN